MGIMAPRLFIALFPSLLGLFGVPLEQLQQSGWVFEPHDVTGEWYEEILEVYRCLEPIENHRKRLETMHFGPFLCGFSRFFKVCFPLKRLLKPVK